MNAPISYTVEQIAKALGAKWLQHDLQNPEIKYISLDSRKINDKEATIFFAIKSRSQDGHAFIESLYNAGVRNFVVEDTQIFNLTGLQANILLVKDTTAALQKLALFHRNNFKELFVIGITGSNGKTIVKEWLTQLLQKENSIARSPKSFNSRIGVPLSIFQISPNNDLAIFEAGISKPGEMHLLEKIIQPTVGILTNIGNAHDEGFKNTPQKINEKLKLFQHSKYLIYCSDEKEISEAIKVFKKENPNLILFSWGKKMQNRFRINVVSKNNSFTKIDSIYRSKPISIIIPFTDDASIQNAICCLCALMILGKTENDVLKRFQSLYPIAMRLEKKPGINNCTIINDSYSNDLQSLSIALDFLSQQKHQKQHTIILSDILQTGVPLSQLYLEVAALLRQKKIDKLIGIGKEISAHQGKFSFLKNSQFFADSNAFLKNIQLHQFKEEAILVKGARQFEFENISQVIEQKVHQTVLSVNLTHLIHNLKKYKERISPETKVMAMVKAFGYGGGSHEIASVLAYNQVDYLAVAYADEGVELRTSGITIPIMVMNMDDSTFDVLINHSLEPELFSFEILGAFTNFLKTNFIENYPVHLKIDTGMHRLGFEPKQIPSLCKKIANNKRLQIKSVFSHLVASDDTTKDEFTTLQFEIFQSACSKIQNALGYPFDKHIANTSAIGRLPDLQLDMVRIGIGLYGIDANKKMQKQLKNVSTLTTTISQIKFLKAGESVGYGRNFLLKKDSTIATVRIGYADGYPRELSDGQGKMWIQNQLVPVVGIVCMDMTMIDITGIKNVKEGDEVLIFGDLLPVEKIAKWADTIPYEIMTGISQRVKRIYFEE